ncbi:hypothetical protein PVAP13_4KG200001 [Panicum virgatum]|uniref:Endonuclease/exonuclease/phosphatase domain-containing protein n=1 Tax=Panicum virgatum TaxID=38727 RepID=A0A8T0TF22_PANVG|nr:hypothetical protein PVAP13_4KG200001 [Panicum virgatum]
MSTRGDSGGGVKDDILKVENWDKGEFYVGATLRNRVNNFRWNLYVIYGPAQHASSPCFLSELSLLGENSVLPYIIGGDFNLVRSQEDQSSGVANKKLMDAFNNYIEQCDLREIRRGGAKYTWTGSQQNPTRSNIDRILMTTSWKQHFPLCNLTTLTIVGSNHCPLLLDTGEVPAYKKKQFYFEKQWLKQDGFSQRLKDKWKEGQNRCPEGAYSLDKWHGLLRLLRQNLRGWGDNIRGDSEGRKNSYRPKLNCWTPSHKMAGLVR